MYLTLYKKNLNNPQNLAYNAIMQNLPTNPCAEYYKTTYHIEHPVPKTQLSYAHQTKITKIEEHLENAWKILQDYEHTHEQQYYTFKIPKHSGGLRTINAPLPEFKNALTQVKEIFEQKIKCLAHDSAYAYIKQRSILDALKKHQANKSNWYLKIDLTDFFPSCTPEHIFQQLKTLYPFYYISKEHDIILGKIIKTCCLNGGLPQGTPISPMLTNLVMVAYDHNIYKQLNRGTGEHYVYTRYADDLIISSKSNFNWKNIETSLATILHPFKINYKKTRYGSKAGSNWNLGLMLNKDNNITLGSEKKKTLNAMLNNFIKDYTKGILWSKEDTQYLQGHLSYLEQIEPDYYNHITKKYQNKYKIQNYKTIIKTILK